MRQRFDTRLCLRARVDEPAGGDKDAGVITPDAPAAQPEDRHRGDRAGRKAPDPRLAIQINLPIDRLRVTRGDQPLGQLDSIAAEYLADQAPAIQADPGVLAAV